PGTVLGGARLRVSLALRGLRIAAPRGHGLRRPGPDLERLGAARSRGGRGLDRQPRGRRRPGGPDRADLARRATSGRPAGTRTGAGASVLVGANGTADARRLRGGAAEVTRSAIVGQVSAL